MIYKNILKKYKGFSLSIDELDLTSQITAILGHIGTGKTTLLKTIGKVNNGQFTSSDHTVFLKQDSHVTPKFHISKLISVYGDFVEEFDNEKAFTYLKKFNIEPYQLITNCSEGEKDIIFTILALSVERDIILLDEPFSRVDPFNRKRLIDLLIQESFDKKIVIATHDLEQIERICEHVFLLKNGKVIADKNFSDLENTDRLKEWYKTQYKKAS